MPYKHIPVMLNEALYYLNCKPGKIFVDCTLGGSGHAKAILKKIVPAGLLIGIDQDKDAIRNARVVLKAYASNIRLFNENFIYLPELLSQLDIDSIDGVLLDLGISLDQLESSGRGFSFKRDEPLDMRMNIESSTKAENLLNRLEKDSLAKIFKEYGEERWAWQIAQKIVKVRKREAIKSTKQLSQIVCSAIPKRRRDSNQRIHPATRVFMALRIAVNRELERLDLFMEKVINLLNPYGRLCVLSFHSLEDRIVKHRIKALEKGCICPPDFPKCVCNKEKKVRLLTKKVLRPSADEIKANPMARSARLRAVEKI